MGVVTIFNVANLSFNAIHKNKILTKISEFTVGSLLIVCTKSILKCSIKVGNDKTIM